MPKYVRTKDRIYEVIAENSDYYKCCYDNGRITLVAKFDNDMNGFSKALKQADTIEELIDQYVFTCEDFKKPELVIPMNFDYCKNTFKHTIIYGAIWTDKGLIYVAKMNEDGNLELL